MNKPYLKEADDDHLSRDSLGQRLVSYIVCDNAAYMVHKNEDDSVVDTIAITQNDLGIDTEDRIINRKDYIKNI